MSVSTSWDVRNLTDVQIDNIINEELEDLQHYSVMEMQKLIKKNNIQLTGDLLESVKADVIAVSKDAYAEMMVDFRGHGRYKDMRVIRHGSVPNIEAMKEFVKKVGLQNFEFIPGYNTGGKMPTTNRAIERIAWGVGIAMFKKGMTRRRGRGFYNIGRSQATKRFRINVMERIKNTLLGALERDIEKE
jgi:hypothetical protein